MIGLWAKEMVGLDAVGGKFWAWLYINVVLLI
jgi:hypothetical protein